MLWNTYREDVAYEHMRQEVPRIANASYYNGQAEWSFEDPHATRYAKHVLNLPGSSPHLWSRFEECVEWARQLSTRDDPVEREAGKIPIYRLVVGMFPFGKYISFVAVRQRMQFRFNDAGERTLTMVALQTLSGIGYVVIPAV
jgi:hypothetical protein